MPIGIGWTLNEINLVPVLGTRYKEKMVSNTVVILPDLYGYTTHIWWTLDGGDIRVTFDGTDPVATSRGHLLKASASGVWRIEVAILARLIRDGATNGRMRITQMEGE